MAASDNGGGGTVVEEEEELEEEELAPLLEEEELAALLEEEELEDEELDKVLEELDRPEASPWAVLPAVLRSLHNEASDINCAAVTPWFFCALIHFFMPITYGPSVGKVGMRRKFRGLCLRVRPFLLLLLLLLLLLPPPPPPPVLRPLDVLIMEEVMSASMSMSETAPAEGRANKLKVSRPC